MSDKKVPTLIDVRQGFEYSSGHIAGSQHVPLGQLRNRCQGWDRNQPLVVVCKSGHRADVGKRQLESLGFKSVTLLPGGIDRWKAAGKPLVETPSTPWTSDRQARIVAGLLILISVVLGYLASPYFFAATAFVGARLLVEGRNEACTHNSIFSKARWSR
jgi:rhodanese-related sulfurtransferase